MKSVVPAAAAAAAASVTRQMIVDGAEHIS